MFESAILAALSEDVTLASYVSTYGGSPAVFSEHAPEGAEMPYITFRIERDTTEALPVQAFSVFVDFWDYNKSRVNARAASERIEFLLDNKQFDHARYSNIRLFRFSAGPVEDSDPRSIHYNHLFSARAGRKKWAQQISS